MKEVKEITRFAKSKPLGTDQRELLKKWVALQETKIDAAETLGISRPTLDRLLLIGTGRGNIISKVKEFLETKVSDKTTA